MLLVHDDHLPVLHRDIISKSPAEELAYSDGESPSDAGRTLAKVGSAIQGGG